MPASVEVRLTPAELLHAAQAGAMRQVQNLKLRRVHRFGASAADGWNMHINGASAECAVAKYLNRYWDGMGALGNFDSADVRGVQVRWRSKDTYELIVHPDDDDAAPFVLVTGDALRYTLKGWLLGADAKQPQWWQDPAGGRPAFFVPTGSLRAIDTLSAWLER